ncbi:MAG: proteasome assembly chaperone family protein [Nanopusillaceae archaeon]
MEFIINKEELKNIKNGIFLYSLGGGYGNLAKIVGKKIKDSTNAKIIGRIITDFFPDIVYIDKNGMIKDNISYKLYKTKINEYDFIILYGDFQISILEDPGFSLYLRYKFTNKLFKILTRYNIQEYVILGGYYNMAMTVESDDPNYFFSFNKYYNIDKIKNKLGEINLMKNSNIIGMSGLTLYFSTLYKKPAYALLIETYPTPQINGYLGAKKAIEILSKIYDFNIDLKDLEDMGKKVREEITRDINKIKELEKQKEEQRRNEYFYFG